MIVVWVHKDRKAVAVLYNETEGQAIADYVEWRREHSLDTSYWIVFEAWKDDDPPPTLDDAAYKKYETVESEEEDCRVVPVTTGFNVVEELPILSRLTGRPLGQYVSYK